MTGTIITSQDELGYWKASRNGVDGYAISKEDAITELEMAEDSIRVKKDQEAYDVKWPNACKYCGGKGSIEAHQSHPYGMGSATEYWTEGCEACIMQDKCPRCAGPLKVDEEGNVQEPCAACGWTDKEPGRPDF